MAEVEERIVAKLEALPEAEARSAIVKGDFGDSPSHPVRRVADAWLAAKDLVRRDAREEEILSVAKDANRLASEANSIARSAKTVASRAERWAMYAAITAISALAISTKDQISSVVMWFLGNGKP